MLDTQLAETRDDLAGTLSQAETWARQLYMAGGSDQTLLVLSSTDLADVGVSLEYLSIVSRETDRALLELEALQRQEQRWIAAAERQERILQRQQVALKAEEDRVAELLEEQIANQQAAEAELARERELLSDVESEIAHFEGELAALEAEQDRIRDAINAEASSDGPGGVHLGLGATGPRGGDVGFRPPAAPDPRLLPDAHRVGHVGGLRRRHQRGGGGQGDRRRLVRRLWQLRRGRPRRGSHHALCPPDLGGGVVR